MFSLWRVAPRAKPEDFAEVSWLDQYDFRRKQLCRVGCQIRGSLRALRPRCVPLFCRWTRYRIDRTFDSRRPGTLP